MILRRQYAIVKENIEPNTKHYIGLPPEVSKNNDSATLLPNAKIVILEDTATEGYYLFRFDPNGNFAGDTNHDTEDQAKKQAQFEFKISFNQWVGIPNDVEDAQHYAFEHAKMRNIKRKNK